MVSTTKPAIPPTLTIINSPAYNIIGCPSSETIVSIAFTTVVSQSLDEPPFYMQNGHLSVSEILHVQTPNYSAILKGH